MNLCAHIIIYLQLFGMIDSRMLNIIHLHLHGIINLLMRNIIDL